MAAMRSDEERKQIASHLEYELMMLWAAAGGLGQQNRALNNCVVEALALHVRNLTDFFYCESPQKDDVVASHFFSDPGAWARMRPAMPEVLDAARKRANKEVSHLTYARLLVTPEAKPWPARDLVAALDATLRCFCDGADLLPERIQLLKYRGLLP